MFCQNNQKTWTKIWENRDENNGHNQEKTGTKIIDVIRKNRDETNGHNLGKTGTKIIDIIWEKQGRK